MFSRCLNKKNKILAEFYDGLFLISKKEKNLSETLKILHLSDLHFGEYCRYQNILQIKDKKKKENLLERIVRDLEDVFKNKDVDIIVISGDITTKYDSEALDDAFIFIKELMKRINNQEHKVMLIVPGNHDVALLQNKREVSKFALKVAKLYKQLYNTSSNFLDIEDIEEIESNGFSMLCIIEKENYVYILCGFDSTLFESDKTKGWGYISSDQRKKFENKIGEIRNEINNSKKQCIPIAVLHHHLLPVTKDLIIGENKEKISKVLDSFKVSLIYDSKDFIEWLINKGFVLVLHGHQHSPYIISESRLNFFHSDVVSFAHGELPILCAGSFSCYDRCEQPGNVISPFNFVNYLEIDPKNGLIKVELYRANPIEKGGFFRENKLAIPITKDFFLRKYLAYFMEYISEKYNTEHDVSREFNSNAYTKVLREVLLALGIIRYENGKLFLNQRQGSEVASSFLKSFSIYLKNNRRVSLFDYDGDFIRNQRRSPYSPLILASYMERKLYDNKLKGCNDTDCRINKYILYAILRSSGRNNLEILHKLNINWDVYLIPAWEVKEEVKDITNCFGEEKIINKDVKNIKIFSYLEKGLSSRLGILSKYVKEFHCLGQYLREKLYPSPSRALLTKYIFYLCIPKFEYNFFNMSVQGVYKNEFNRQFLVWFTEKDLRKRKHLREREIYNFLNKMDTFDFQWDYLYPDNMDVIKIIVSLARKRNIVWSIKKKRYIKYKKWL